MAADLLRWFDQERRDLPWRRDRDPYRILVSEIMLQQTRVEVVAPRYEAFVARFPDVESLAGADGEDVRAAWSGLGYYRRAERLHRAAREVSRGGWPRGSRSLRKLPGIGEYTAAAIASIAFDERVLAVDGNVERVLSRFSANGEDPKRAATRRRLVEVGLGLLTRRRPGDGNQALMELGATVCRPQRADCDRCPLRSSCVAAEEGRPERFPVLRPARPRVQRRLHAVLIEAQGRLLVERRGDEEQVLPGCWLLPSIEMGAGREVSEAGWLETLRQRLGGRVELGSEQAELRHAITYRDYTVVIRRARWQPDPGPGTDPGTEGTWTGDDLRWIDPGRLDEIPTSSLLQKCLRAMATLVPER